MKLVPYPSRPILDSMAPFKHDLKNGYNQFQRDRFDAFVAQQYTAGLSLRQVAELTGRTQTAVRRSLDRSGVPRRDRGAPRLSETPKRQ
ncbi:helix-turn-helix domain-containing protein [Georgenia satyanarayanai]|uniref:helix-turn-helix domain-containing protein n=1 Tax=Georgenia satyanarayanai TaxID=860221 RepID=UPI0012652E92|nr:helix-turn-helix domain-containing protein [Georgenia satyanarayanai]